MKFFDFFKDEDSMEKIVGGIFGAVAIGAIVVEMCLGRFETAVIASGVKDIFGTLITVVMLFVAIKALKPKKTEPFSFEKEFKEELELFVARNERMLTVKDESNGNLKYYELYMESDFNAFFGEKTKLKSGWFMRIPPIDEKLYSKGNITMQFHLNKGTFFAHNKLEDEKKAYKEIGEKIKSLFLRESSKDVLLDCQYIESEKIVEINFKNPITTKDDIKKIINIIEKVYNCYLVLGVANINKD